jgi:putative PIN family toxin of toxin-antitoxin system
MPDHALPSLAVLDTNAVLDWLVFHDGGMAAIARAIEACTVQWIATPAMLQEFERVLAYPTLAPRNPDIARLRHAWQRHAWICAPAPPAACLQCKDSDDQKFLDLALAHKAAWLVSKDKALLALRKKALAHGCVIVRPEAFSMQI